MQSPQTIVPVGTQTTFVEVWKWGQELEHLHARIAPRFVRPEPRKRALAFLKGIVSSIERKNGWQLAEQAGESCPDRMQRLLNSAVWDANLVHDYPRVYRLSGNTGVSHPVFLTPMSLVTCSVQTTEKRDSQCQISEKLPSEAKFLPVMPENNL